MKGIFGNLKYLILALCLLSPQIADASNYSGVDFDILSAGVGARPLGMGGAFTAIADNADAPYWNAAGLSNISSSEITTMQTKMSSDADHYYVSYVTKFLKGTLGVSWMQISLGSISQTTTTDAFNDVITTNIFSYFSNAYLLAYGLPINPALSFGLAAKYLSTDMTQISGGQAYGYSITPSFLLKPNLGLSIGFKIDELLNEQRWGTGAVEKVAPKARLGVALNEVRVLPKGSTVSFDLAQALQSSYAPEFALGYEWMANPVSLRLGLMDQAVTAGAGFDTGFASLDYAYVKQNSLSKDNVHRISLSGKW